MCPVYSNYPVLTMASTYFSQSIDNYSAISLGPSTSFGIATSGGCNA